MGPPESSKSSKKALYQCKKMLPHVLKASKLMILWDAKNVIKPVWNQGFWCCGTSQIIKNIKKALHQRKKSLYHKPTCYITSTWNDYKMLYFIVFFWKKSNCIKKVSKLVRTSEHFWKSMKKVSKLARTSEQFWEAFIKHACGCSEGDGLKVKFGDHV